MKKEKIYFVVTERWFNEDECPANHNAIVNVCESLEDAQEAMETAFLDASGDLRDLDDENEMREFTDNHDERICSFEKNDDSVWYECRIVEVKKWFEDGDELDPRVEIKEPSTL